VGSFPHLPLYNVRVGAKVNIKREKMAVQLGPDRFIIDVDKNITKIPHAALRTVGVRGARRVRLGFVKREYWWHWN